MEPREHGAKVKPGSTGCGGARGSTHQGGAGDLKAQDGSEQLGGREPAKVELRNWMALAEEERERGWVGPSTPLGRTSSNKDDLGLG